MLYTRILALAAAANMVASAPLEAKRDIIDYGVRVDSENNGLGTKRDIIDYGVQSDSGKYGPITTGDSSFIEDGQLPDGTKFKKFKRGKFEILDFGVRNTNDSSLISKRTTDGVSSCGKTWMP